MSITRSNLAKRAGFHFASRPRTSSSGSESGRPSIPKAIPEDVGLKSEPVKSPEEADKKAKPGKRKHVKFATTVKEHKRPPKPSGKRRDVIKMERKDSNPFYALLPVANLSKNSPLSMQPQDEVVRKIRNNMLRKLPPSIRKDFHAFPESQTPLIESVNIHLLTAESGRLTYDIAEYMGKETVGKKVMTEFLKGPSEGRKLGQSRLIKEFQKEFVENKSLESFKYPTCKGVLSNWNDQNPPSILGPGSRNIKSYRPSRRHLWVINKSCPWRLRHKNSDGVGVFGGSMSVDETSLPKAKGLKSKKHPRSKSGKGKAAGSYANAPSNSDTHWDVTSATDLLAEDVDSAFTDDTQAEDEVLTMIQADVEDEWSMEDLRKGHRSKRNKPSGRFSKRPANSEPKLTTFHLIQDKGVKESVQKQPERSSLKGHLSGRASARRLIKRISADCTPPAIYQRYRRSHQIRISPNKADYVSNYNSVIFQKWNERLVDVLGRGEVILNDREFMRLAEDRLRTMLRQRLATSEKNLEQNEVKRIQASLNRDGVNTTLLDAELLIEGEKLDEQRRKDPAILLQKVLCQGRAVPVFCPNPLKEEYLDSHSETEIEMIRKLTMRQSSDVLVPGRTRGMSRRISRRMSRRLSKALRKMRNSKINRSEGSLEIDFEPDSEQDTVEEIESSSEGSQEESKQRKSEVFIPKAALSVDTLDSLFDLTSTSKSFKESQGMEDLYREARKVIHRPNDTDDFPTVQRVDRQMSSSASSTNTLKGMKQVKIPWD
ncbi:unnamed protein product [Calicophoron daubneyi]|uniref:Uncharacterized protein n=1 Tax=Calicophoron daubneyi TaxID=300641 RepID=A0AAV2T879_CALDB